MTSLPDERPTVPRMTDDFVVRVREALDRQPHDADCAHLVLGEEYIDYWRGVEHVYIRMTCDCTRPQRQAALVVAAIQAAITRTIENVQAGEYKPPIKPPAIDAALSVLEGTGCRTVLRLREPPPELACATCGEKFRGQHVCVAWLP